jgi:hypothetical protein
LAYSEKSKVKNGFSKKVFFVWLLYLVHWQWSQGSTLAKSFCEGIQRDEMKVESFLVFSVFSQSR